jgi:hypothetical protein
LVGGQRYEFYLEKKETCTTLYGPFWYYFERAHHLEVDDVVTFKLPSEDEKLMILMKKIQKKIMKKRLLQMCLK